MFIQTENTPNPNSLKFIPGIEIAKGKTYIFKNIAEASCSPLATSIFNIVGVKEVFFGHDFITITKDNGQSWEVLKTEILLTLTDCIAANIDIIKDDVVEKNDKNTEEESTIVKEIREIIDIKIKPAVAQDGGDIVFHSFVDGIVKVKMQGACSGCPSSTVTLKNGIESMLQYYVPEVKSVEAVSDDQ